MWLTWWLGDAGGAIVLAPAIVLWWQSPRLDWTREQWFELAALLLAIAAVGSIAFGGALSPPGSDQPLRFLCLPLTIWTAFRFGRRETAAVVVILSAETPAPMNTSRTMRFQPSATDFVGAYVARVMVGSRSRSAAAMAISCRSRSSSARGWFPKTSTTRCYVGGVGRGGAS